MSQPPRVLFNFTEDDIASSAPCVATAELAKAEQKIDNVIDELCESDGEDLLLDDVKDVKEDRLNLPSIEREKIVQEDIFDVKQNVTEKVKPEKKKRQLSEEHRAKLALAREKALATRRAKAEEKMKMKAIENETKELKKKKATKELETLKEEVNNEKPLPANISSKQSQNIGSFTLKDLEQAQLSAIMTYEQVRKARKEEKKKQKMIEEQQQKLKNQINNFTKTPAYGARDANGMLLNKWHGCY